MHKPALLFCPAGGDPSAVKTIRWYRNLRGSYWETLASFKSYWTQNDDRVYTAYKSLGVGSDVLCRPQLFLQRERAAVLAEAQTDDLIKEAPKAALDQSGQWQETGGEIQWVANDNDSDKQDEGKKKKEDEEDEELDLNKGTTRVWLWSLLTIVTIEQQKVRHDPRFCPSSAACREAHGGQYCGLLHGTAAGLPMPGEPGESETHTHTHSCVSVSWEDVTLTHLFPGD